MSNFDKNIIEQLFDYDPGKTLPPPEEVKMIFYHLQRYAYQRYLDVMRGGVTEKEKPLEKAFIERAIGVTELLATLFAAKPELHERVKRIRTRLESMLRVLNE
ncbi:hypothetical protein HY285_03765 [Candidatus Peregrinibacteria bacterium]|nr:hypothetical protein [Candidatus Peregrinibacteria bacterium]MBI3816633.1 hypothetical protein [Candidatus Peregrinibacteria bacterium]